MRFTHATASRIKTYKQCPFRYFLEYMVEFPPMRSDNIYTGKGSAVHEALEGWTNFKLGRKKENDEDEILVEENYEETLRKYYEEHKVWTLDQRMPDKNGKPKGFPHPVEKSCESCPWATKDDRCKIANQAIEAVDGCPRPNFEDDLALVEKTLNRTDYDPLALNDDGKFKRKIIGAEVPFDMEVEGVRVKGVIDLVAEENKDTLEIIDYKTGKSMSFDKARNDPQVRTYGAVARKLWPQYKYIIVTLHYLRKYPVSIPLSFEDDILTIRSLRSNKEQIESDTSPYRVRPSKWGFPCDWCIGHDNCGKIEESFKRNGRFRLPVISCSFVSPNEPCWGNIHAVPNQDVDFESVPDMLYTCKGHGKVHGGGEYAPKPDDSGETSRRHDDNSEEISDYDW